MNIYFASLIYLGIVLRSFINANICSYTENAESICCEGWAKNVYGDCIKSECFHDCGYGKCVGLNICECFDGTTRSDACPHPKQRLCPNGCSNRGKCQDWKCVCISGYTGLDCNTSIVSTCYVKVNRGLCKSTLEGLQLTQEECCSIFQMAWGNPCKFCQAKNYCAKGFIMKNGQCEDIDECRLNGICLHGRCINERGSFRCQCPPHYMLNENTMACQPFKEVCEIFGSNCGSYGVCVPLITGEYKCICKNPFEASEDGKKCVRRKTYNVCRMFGKLCQPNGECQPLGMSYICKCQYGFIQSHDRKSCRINLSSNTNNEDLCRNPEVSQKCINGQCISDSDTYKCVCYPPYKTSYDSQECILNKETPDSERNYCARPEYSSKCQGGECINGYKSYYCKCRNGYRSLDNGRRCEQYDTDNNPGRNPDTSNILCRNPSYSSRCKGGQCVADQIYGFKCICLPGFTASSDGRACNTVRIDPCSKNSQQCSPGRCQSISDNDFQCICPSPLTKSPDGRKCFQNFVTTKASFTYCDMPQYKERCATGECIPDNNYGFKCICTSGYRVAEDGRSCHKISRPDACLTNAYRCNSGRCKPIGEYDFECDCPLNMKRSEDGRSCLSNYQVTQEPSTYCDNAKYKGRCDPGQCIPDPYYGFKCICSSGYAASEDGRMCHKNDNLESICSRYQSNCNGGKCLEKRNNEYECQCLEGYQRSSDGRSCHKYTKSVCEMYGSRCLTGVCYPTGDQSYMCLCSSGYSPIDDSKACEKKTFESICKKYESNCLGGTCVELRNSDYKCHCLNGYHKSGDGRSCIKDYQSACDKYGMRCLTGVCYPSGEDDYICLCAMGYVAIDDNRACSKKAPNSLCATFGHKCQGNLCEDKNGDYKCLCMLGFKSSEDGRSCEKNAVEEKCIQYKSRCRDGFCFDIIRGYLCVCSSNYVVSDDGRFCNENDVIMLKSDNNFDISESKESRICTNKYQKQCYPGSCVKLRERYSCICPHSFVVTDDGEQCIRDQKKCPQCYYGCISGEPYSKCSCPLNYEDLLNTGLCLKPQSNMTYTLSDFRCNSSIKINQTFVVNFSGYFSEDSFLVKPVHRNIAKIFEAKQLKRAKLNHCSPDLSKPFLQKKYVPSLSWKVVCIFDC